MYYTLLRGEWYGPLPSFKQIYVVGHLDSLTSNFLIKLSQNRFVLKKIGVLCGGERVKAALARLLYERL